MTGNSTRPAGLERIDDVTPARRLTIADLTTGDAVEQEFVFGESQLAAFAVLANDRAPVHGDERFARRAGFAGPIIQGLCVTTRFSRLIGMYLPGEHAILQTVSFKYREPVHAGDPFVFRVEVVRLLPPMNVVRLALSVRSNAGVHVTGEAQCLIR